jgi:hypothetical protein
MVTTIKFDKECKARCGSKYLIHVDSGQKLLSWWIDSTGAGWMTIDPPPGCEENATLCFTPIGPNCYPGITLGACAPRNTITWNTTDPRVQINAYDVTDNYRFLCAVLPGATPFATLGAGNDDVVLVPTLTGGIPFNTITWDDVLQGWRCGVNTGGGGTGTIVVTVVAN